MGMKTLRKLVQTRISGSIYAPAKDKMEERTDVKTKRSITESMMYFDILDEHSKHRVSNFNSFARCAVLLKTKLRSPYEDVKNISSQELPPPLPALPTKQIVQNPPFETSTSTNSAILEPNGVKTRPIAKNEAPIVSIDDLIKINVYLLQKIHDEIKTGYFPAEIAPYMVAMAEGLQECAGDSTQKTSQNKVKMAKKDNIAQSLTMSAEPNYDLFIDGSHLKTVRDLKSHWENPKNTATELETSKYFSTLNSLAENREVAMTLFHSYKKSWKSFKKAAEEFKKEFNEDNSCSQFQKFSELFEIDFCSIQAYKTISEILSNTKNEDLRFFFKKHVSEIYQDSPHLKKRLESLRPC